MVDVLRNRNFFYFFSGTFVSSIGDVLFNFAIGLYILHLTHSAFQLSFYGMIGAVTWLVLTPIGGVFTDRWNRVKIIYVTEMIRGISVVSCGIVMMMVNDKQIILYILYFTTFIIAVNGSLFSPASQALVPTLVGKNDLLKANSLMSLTYSMKDVFGILLAGLMYALLGPVVLVLINGVSYLLSCIAALFINVKEERFVGNKKNHIFIDLKDAFRYILKENKQIIWLLLMVNVVNLSSGPIQSVLLPYLMKEFIKAPEMHLSYLYSAVALGGVCGTLIVSKLKISNYPVKMMKGSFIILFLAIASQLGFFILFSNRFITYPIYLSLLIVVFFISGIINLCIMIPVLTFVQKVVRQEYYGRVMALFSTLSAITVPFSMMIGGYLIDQFGISILYYLSISILFISLVIVNIKMKERSIEMKAEQ